MCGIFGTIHAKIGPELAAKMGESLKHRGPDGRGVFFSPDRSVCLGQTRLAIIDLSDGGKQPMQSSREHHKRSGVTIVFNGEIYNYKNIREELIELGYQFISSSDTEVLLVAYIEWGMDMLSRLRGMFAFAISDEEKDVVYLCRDRFGVKPLYYWMEDQMCVFASELKTILLYPKVEKKIHLESVQAYLTYGYIPGPQTIYNNITKIRPGTFLIFDKNGPPTETVYWSSDKKPEVSFSYPTDDAWLQALEDQLKESFNYRMVADVPVGVFLSGGIDSSLVATLLQKNQTEKIHTFTLGFHEHIYDEAIAARKIATTLGTNHHEFFVSPEDVRAAVSMHGQLFDEPFGDSSSLVTSVLAQHTKNQVKVVLSGDGGDELFYGYTKYTTIVTLTKIPWILRFILHKCIETLGPARVARIYTELQKYVPLPRFSNMREKLSKLSFTLAQKSVSDMVKAGGTYWRPDDIRHLLKKKQVFIESFSLPKASSLEELVQLVDLQQYLPDDILVKTDRTTMAVGLEAREPYIDHVVWNFVQTMPPEIRYRNPGTKDPLRRILAKYLPSSLFHSPKTGFRPPLYEWLHGDLAPLLERYFSRSFIETQGIFEIEEVEKLFHTWKTSYVNPDKIWLLLAFQLWYDAWITPQNHTH